MPLTLTPTSDTAGTYAKDESPTYLGRVWDGLKSTLPIVSEENVVPTNREATSASLVLTASALLGGEYLGHVRSTAGKSSLLSIIPGINV